MLKFILTCEHGGNRIPLEYRSYFLTHQDLLQSHRGYDIGALDIFGEMVRQLKPEFSRYSTVSRLLIELNRSIGNPNLFSDISKNFSQAHKDRIVELYYQPYREACENIMLAWAEKNHTILHISVHTFTPVLDGEERKADIGLLYDPKRNGEKECCKLWKEEIEALDKNYKVRLNYPYQGTSDGITTYFRKKFSDAQYIGIELEVNQKYLDANASASVKASITQLIIESLRKVLHTWRTQLETV
ncbi:MAG: N-formylglutamate amidohydrolase [Flammeovirgaceae bacterium]|nr:N-formylglutamate amidohydrolase [Flammeovirgaceae bacterium]MDW8286507.1 N-formylglutamate amidohydrolase [Flammeovirgaceae bacterium]